MDNFFKSPEVQKLLKTFVDGLSDLLEDVVVQHLAGRERAPKRVPKPKRAQVFSKGPVRALKLTGTSPEMVNRVEMRLSSLAVTSQQMADVLEAGETSVRYALKHLAQTGRARTEKQGRTTKYRMP